LEILKAAVAAANVALPSGLTSLPFPPNLIETGNPPKHLRIYMNPHSAVAAMPIDKTLVSTLFLSK
jgi:hypothetical protein